jgi:hypothetical protein
VSKNPAEVAISPPTELRGRACWGHRPRGVLQQIWCTHVEWHDNNHPFGRRWPPGKPGKAGEGSAADDEMTNGERVQSRDLVELGRPAPFHDAPTPWPSTPRAGLCPELSRAWSPSPATDQVLTFSATL